MARNGVQLRLATVDDARELARLHQSSAQRQAGAFLHQLGRAFLVAYYRTALREPGTVALCAEQEGRMVGFVFGCLRTEDRLRSLRRNRVRLALAALPAILRRPQLFRLAYARQAVEPGENGTNRFIMQSGAREEYWAWEPTARSGSAVALHLKWLSIMKTLGATRIRGEVDEVNTDVERMHRMLGATVIDEFTTPDGKHRVIIEYRLGKKTEEGS